MTGWGFCYEGHDKSAHYTKDAEVDSWGYPVPCEEGTKGAEKCMGKFSGARDFYELSQVFLGAQYFAALADKNPNMAGVIKAAGVKPIGLSPGEAKNLPIPHEPEEVLKARKSYEITRDDESNITWQDESGLVWIFSPDDGEVLCLGKKNEEDSESNPSSSNKEGGDPKDGVEDDSGQQPIPEQDGVSESGERTDGGEPDRSEPEQVEADGSDPDAKNVQPKRLEVEEAEEMADKHVIAAAKSAGVPQSFLEKAMESRTEGESLVGPLFASVLEQNATLEKQVGELTGKAELGITYLKDLQTEAIDWYVKARQNGNTGTPVSTTMFGKIVEACGENADLLKELIKEQKGITIERFPAVLRSSFPSDPNVAEMPGVPDLEEKEVDTSRVSKLHG